MLPIGCGMDGYIELKPDWNGNLEAIAAAAETECGDETPELVGVVVPPLFGESKPIECVIK